MKKFGRRARHGDGRDARTALGPLKQRARRPKLSLIERLADALYWAGGSADFAPGGQARRGWLKCAAPALREFERMKAPGAVY